MLSKEHCYLNVLLLSKLMLDLLDQLQGTKQYRHSLKAKINLLMKEIEVIVEGDLTRLWELDNVLHEDMYRIMDYQENLLREISQLRPEDYGVLAEMTKQFRADREYFLQKMDLTIVDTHAEDPV